MASSISRPWLPSESRSGGKIVRGRRTAGRGTPYDRPQSPSNSSPNPQNPNWLSRLIYSPTRMIATGAGKLLSSVFTNDSSSSSSSSSDYDSEDDIDDENDATDELEKNGTLEISEHVRSETQPIVERSFETKRLIEQLLMQVTFSREECDRLTSIIESRVDKGPFTGDTGDRRLTELYNRTIGSGVDMPDHCSAAVIEAKRWLEEKKSGSSPMSDTELGACTLNSAMSPHVTEGEMGSPMDMAKSYMLKRPPWASPSANHIEYRSPSPTGIRPLKEEMPYSTDYTSFKSSKLKRDSPASGSWNILEEIRKVRSKATEEMLRTPPSSKIDWTLFALENKSVINPLVADESETSMGDKVHSSTKPVTPSVDVASGVSTSDDFPVTQVTREMLQNETVLPNPATVSEQNQDIEGTQTVKETTERLSSGQKVKSSENVKTVLQSDADATNIDGRTGTNGCTQPFDSPSGGTAEGLKVVLALNAIPDSGLNKQNCSAPTELARKGGSLAVNDFPTSGSSFPPGQDTEQNSRSFNENENPVASDHDEVPPNAPSVEVCEFLSETSVEVPVVRENDSTATGSENGSSMQNEGLRQGVTTTNSNHHKTTGAGVGARVRGRGRAVVGAGDVEKQQGKKLNRYNRRGRGMGRGK